MDNSVFKKLGLNEKEIIVYLKLLQSGPVSVRNLADLTSLNRGNVYDVLKRLQELGLVSFFHRDTKQNFVAEDPEKIVELLHMREQELKQLEIKVSEIIPELKSLQEKVGEKPVTKFYEGKSGVRFILDDILMQTKKTEAKEYYVYSAEGVREDVYSAYPDFSKKRIKSKIKAKTISLSPGGGTYGFDERKWLGAKETSENMTYILIYDGHCAFISRDLSGNPVGVIIENRMIYETQKTIFLQLWNLI
jgi:HTH-type transcriptional regulator, sugar sensing transcriptional regulator